MPAKSFDCQTSQHQPSSHVSRYAVEGYLWVPGGLVFEHWNVTGYWLPKTSVILIWQLTAMVKMHFCETGVHWLLWPRVRF
jgi:hypothetical protein